MTTSNPKLRWYQYRLRTLLILGLLASLGLSWYAVRSGPARTQEEAVARIQAAGGEVSYDPDSGGKDVNGVTFWPGSSATDADLRHLQALKHLESLTIAQESITDAGLRHLEGLKSLKRLSVGADQITDAGLKYLEGLKSLESLSFGGNRITDAGLMYLEGLKSLEDLSFGGNQITDAGLKHLAGLDRLWRLGFGGNRITDAGLKHLERLPVRHLTLVNTQVTGAGLDRFTQLELLRVWYSPLNDAALKRLEPLPHLLLLDLQQTNITDAGLNDLKLPSLTRLQLDDRLLGTEGVQAFQKAHPECYVTSMEEEVRKKDSYSPFPTT